MKHTYLKLSLTAAVGPAEVAWAKGALLSGITAEAEAAYFHHFSSGATVVEGISTWGDRVMEQKGRSQCRQMVEWTS
jgi:hypothetical protein